jgi:hypothetical protein
MWLVKMISVQSDLFSSPAPVAAPADKLSADRELLFGHLKYYKLFRTRAQITEALGWTERHLRDVAESLGSDIVRCQAGFKLTEDITREELGIALQASDSFLSQGKRMIRYALSLRKKLHHLIG